MKTINGYRVLDVEDIKELEIPIINWFEIFSSIAPEPMSEDAAESMNNIKISEMRSLLTGGFVAVCGNGQLTQIVAKEDAEKAERERTQHGY